MNILSKTYIFYADVYFIQNFIIKAAVLYLSLCTNKQYRVTTTGKGILKISLVSLLGTLIEIIGLIYGNSYSVFIALVHVLEIPLMIGVVLGKERCRIVPVIIAGYFFMMLVNGVLEILWNQFGRNGNYLFYLISACGVVVVSVRIWQNYSKIQKGIFRVKLIHQEKSVVTYGFYDSGNHLVDIYTGKGVQIISENVFQKLGLENEDPVLLPFQALGNETGIIEVFYIEKFIIEGEKENIQLEKCPLGVTKDDLFKGKKYEIILNEEVF
ncbi:MAG: sigma-E processing peptidase SpoIIGA [Agathobacter sp.]|nr:sigma-E processing peptidase SpoIIGA [Agathobacter sp.]